jgi:hypothetical protein
MAFLLSFAAGKVLESGQKKNLHLKNEGFMLFNLPVHLKTL